MLWHYAIEMKKRTIFHFPFSNTAFRPHCHQKLTGKCVWVETTLHVMTIQSYRHNIQYCVSTKPRFQEAHLNKSLSRKSHTDNRKTVAAGCTYRATSAFRTIISRSIIITCLEIYLHLETSYVLLYASHFYVNEFLSWHNFENKKLVSTKNRDYKYGLPENKMSRKIFGTDRDQGREKWPFIQLT